MSNESTIPTPTTSDVCTIQILVDGEVMSSGFNILSVVVNHELNRIPYAVIQLQDGEAAKATFAASNHEYFVPGKNIEIKLGYRARQDTVFKGDIIKHSIKIRKNASILTIECRDRSFQMTLGKKNRSYQNSKDSDVMEEIINRYLLPNEITSTKSVLKELVQYDATDWDFIICRAEANGYIVKIQNSKLIIAPPALQGKTIITVHYGTTLLELDAEIDVRNQSKAIKASSWNANEQAWISSEAQEPTIPNAGNLSISDLTKNIKDDSNEIVHGGEIDATELQVWANAQLLRERLAKIRGRVRLQGFAAIEIDSIIEITGIGNRFEGLMYVSGVRHKIINGNWETDVQFGIDPVGFIANQVMQTVPAAGLLPAVNGLQIGIVTALENDPHAEDRVQVRLPLSANGSAGLWARIATLDAGHERGTFFRPEIGDEVIIGFLNNDPRYPIILGMCHSGAKAAPERAQDNNPRKGYVSREKMQLIFDDEKKSINIETPKSNRICLSEEEQSLVLQDQNGNKMIFDSNGINIISSKSLTLSAIQDLNISGLNLALDSHSNLKITALNSTEIAGTTLKVQGSVMTVIKGGIVQIN